jgi:pimeloyl-ACP methyl ester carboxylesterase
VQKLAIYEAPYNDDSDARQAWKEFRKQLAEVLAAGCRGDAVALFMTLLGVPADQIEGMRQYPMWPMWEAVAPTIAYDAAALGEDASVPTGRAATLGVPVLIMDGEASYPFMHESATALANAIPNAQHRTLAGQIHEVTPEALAPVLVEFFQA